MISVIKRPSVRQFMDSLFRDIYIHLSGWLFRSEGKVIIITCFFIREET